MHNRVGEHCRQKEVRYCRLYYCRGEAVVLLERLLLSARRDKISSQCDQLQGQSRSEWCTRWQQQQRGISPVQGGEGGWKGPRFQTLKPFKNKKNDQKGTKIKNWKTCNTGLFRLKRSRKCHYPTHFFYKCICSRKGEKQYILPGLLLFFHYLKFSFKLNVNMRNKYFVVKHIFFKGT